MYSLVLDCVTFEGSGRNSTQCYPRGRIGTGQRLETGRDGEGRVGTSPSNERAVLARFAKSETTSSRPRSFKKGLIMLGGAALSQLTFFFFFFFFSPVFGGGRGVRSDFSPLKS